jgi:hypothetical protein
MVSQDWITWRTISDFTTILHLYWSWMTRQLGTGNVIESYSLCVWTAHVTRPASRASLLAGTDGPPPVERISMIREAIIFAVPSGPIIRRRRYRL